MSRLLVALAAALLLAGCAATPAAPTAGGVPSVSAGTSSAAPTTSPTGTPGASPSVTVQVVEVSLRNGKASPNGDRLTLAKGTVLRLEISSDHGDEVHVHGYDVEIAVTPDATVTKDIMLDQVGRFEIESHEPALTILQLVVS
ncbi:MAG TPA: hypothetical protein VGK18_16760 [Propionicimonas sp.]|uniref:hypothetical protein n=1 Tax=Propionicimonas sp. TaxID=1955623 RepID=UPI002F3F9E4E